jgi:hypothetical protein
MLLLVGPFPLQHVAPEGARCELIARTPQNGWSLFRFGFPQHLSDIAYVHGPQEDEDAVPSFTYSFESKVLTGEVLP